MNWSSWLVSGFLSTLLLTTLMAASQSLGLTRMNIPYLLGTMFTPNRDLARLYGFVFHVVNGWLFSLLYVAGFETWNLATWWIGALLGLLHGAVVLVLGMAILPAIHPRMASETRGPTVVRQLEPPGFLALHYGVRTPLSVLAAHAIFGGLLGALYRLA